MCRHNLNRPKCKPLHQPYNPLNQLWRRPPLPFRQPRLQRASHPYPLSRLWNKPPRHLLYLGCRPRVKPSPRSRLYPLKPRQRLKGRLLLQSRQHRPAKEWVAVQRGDTMYKIAAKYKLADMNLERMLVALYRANADKFDGRNMNRIRAGKILQLPTQEEYEAVTLPEAVKEIHAQASDWNAYRQKLASAANANNQTEAAEQVASGKISSSVTDQAPVAKESAKEVLRLSKGEAPGDHAAMGAGGTTMSAQDKKNAAQEDAIAKAKAEQESQARAAMLEKNLQDMKRLAQLKTEAAALAQPQAAAASAPTPAPVKPVEAHPAKPQPKEVKPEPTLVDQIIGEPLYQAGAAAVLLVMGGIGFMLYRRKKKHFEDEVDETGEDIGSISGSFKAPVVPSPDTGDFTGTNAMQSAAGSFVGSRRSYQRGGLVPQLRP